MSDQVAAGWKPLSGRRASVLRAISPVKLAVAMACLTAAAWLLGPTLLYVESSQAVTNAPVTVIRSPIGGVLKTVLADPGQTLAESAPVAVVVNDYWDPTALLDAGNRLIEARRRLDEATQEAAVMRLQQGVLLRDHAAWLAGMLSVTEHERLVAEAGLASARARFDTARTMLARYGDLAKVGAVNLQRLDEVKLTAVTAGRDLEGAQASVATARAREQALRKGMLLSADDRPATLQRLDDLAVRLAALDAARAAGATEVAALIEQKNERERQRERETRTELRAGSGGRLWRFFNRPGDRIAQNAVVANVIDCDRTDVTAIFSQRDVGSLAIGRAVTVRVAGIDGPISGRIADANGYYDAETRSAEAVNIKALEKGSVLVRVDLDQAVPGCLVGLHATVRLD